MSWIMDLGQEKGEVVREPKKFLEVVEIPRSIFLMGSPDDDADAFDDERPQRRVYLDWYMCLKFPVTKRQFRHFMQETGYMGQGDLFLNDWVKGPDNKPLHPPKGKEDHPVTFVSWYDAKAFSDAYGLFLLSEAQWEKAARGTDGKKYPWGDEPPDTERPQCNHAGKFGGTTPVDMFDGTHEGAGDGRSPYGVYDMAGNVWEWCSNRWIANLLEIMVDDPETGCVMNPMEGVDIVDPPYIDPCARSGRFVTPWESASVIDLDSDEPSSQETGSITLSSLGTEAPDPTRGTSNSSQREGVPNQNGLSGQPGIGRGSAGSEVTGLEDNPFENAPQEGAATEPTTQPSSETFAVPSVTTELHSRDFPTPGEAEADRPTTPGTAGQATTMSSGIPDTSSGQGSEVREPAQSSGVHDGPFIPGEASTGSAGGSTPPSPTEPISEAMSTAEVGSHLAEEELEYVLPFILNVAARTPLTIQQHANDSTTVLGGVDQDTSLPTEEEHDDPLDHSAVASGEEPGMRTISTAGHDSIGGEALRTSPSQQPNAAVSSVVDRFVQEEDAPSHNTRDFSGEFPSMASSSGSTRLATDSQGVPNPFYSGPLAVPHTSEPDQSPALSQPGQLSRPGSLPSEQEDEFRPLSSSPASQERGRPEGTSVLANVSASPRDSILVLDEAVHDPTCGETSSTELDPYHSQEQSGATTPSTGTSTGSAGEDLSTPSAPSTPGAAGRDLPFGAAPHTAEDTTIGQVSAEAETGSSVNGTASTSVSTEEPSPFVPSSGAVGIVEDSIDGSDAPMSQSSDSITGEEVGLVEGVGSPLTPTPLRGQPSTTPGATPGTSSAADSGSTSAGFPATPTTPTRAEDTGRSGGLSEPQPVSAATQTQSQTSGSERERDAAWHEFLSEESARAGDPLPQAGRSTTGSLSGSQPSTPRTPCLPSQSTPTCHTEESSPAGAGSVTGTTPRSPSSMMDSADATRPVQSGSPGTLSYVEDEGPFVLPGPTSGARTPQQNATSGIGPLRASQAAASISTSGTPTTSPDHSGQDPRHPFPGSSSSPEVSQTTPATSRETSGVARDTAETSGPRTASDSERDVPFQESSDQTPSSCPGIPGSYFSNLKSDQSDISTSPGSATSGSRGMESTASSPVAGAGEDDGPFGGIPSGELRAPTSDRCLSSSEQTLGAQAQGQGQQSSTSEPEVRGLTATERWEDEVQHFVDTGEGRYARYISDRVIENTDPFSGRFGRPSTTELELVSRTIEASVVSSPADSTDGATGQAYNGQSSEEDPSWGFVRGASDTMTTMDAGSRQVNGSSMRTSSARSPMQDSSGSSTILSTPQPVSAEVRSPHRPFSGADSIATSSEEREAESLEDSATSPVELTEEPGRERSWTPSPTVEDLREVPDPFVPVDATLGTNYRLSHPEDSTPSIGTSEDLEAVPDPFPSEDVIGGGVRRQGAGTSAADLSSAFMARLSEEGPSPAAEAAAFNVSVESVAAYLRRALRVGGIGRALFDPSYFSMTTKGFNDILRCSARCETNNRYGGNYDGFRMGG